MLTRVLGVPAAAVVVLVAAPGVVIRTISPPSQPPAPPAGAVSVHLTGGSGNAYLLIAAKGRPTSTMHRLVDADGLHPATVTRAPTAKCAGARLRRTLTGAKHWCLHVVGIEAGRQLTGTIPGGTTLTLTIVRRDGRLWPALIILLGFLAAALVPAFSKRLRTFAGELSLAQLLEKNDNAGANRVTGAQKFVSDQLDCGDSPDDVRSTLSAIFAKGPEQIRAARGALKTRVTDADLPESNPLRKQAYDEATRTDFAMTDFVGEDGNPKKTSCAADLLQPVDILDNDYRHLVALQRDITEHLTDACASEARAAVDKALAMIEQVDAPDKVGSVAEPFADANAVYQAKTEDTHCLKVEPQLARRARSRRIQEYVYSGALAVQAKAMFREAFMLDPDFHVDLGTIREYVREVHELVLPPALDLRHVALETWTTLGKLATALAIGVVVIFAGITVWQAGYEPKASFAGFGDYFALFSAAFASGAAASVLALLAIWRPTRATQA